MSFIPASQTYALVKTDLATNRQGEAIGGAGEGRQGRGGRVGGHCRG